MKQLTARQQYQRQCRIERLYKQTARLNEINAAIMAFDAERKEQREIQDMNRAAGWKY